MTHLQHIYASIYITGFICFATLYPASLKLAILSGNTVPKKHWWINWLTWSFVWPFILIYIVLSAIKFIVLGEE